jgi:FkbM family methyltransferase
MSAAAATFGEHVATALRRPVVRYRRWRWSGADPMARALLEAVDYRRSMVEFMEATERDPAILLEAHLDEHSVVVDAGAYVGEWSARIADRYGSRIVAFEPVPAHVAEMRRRLGARRGITVVPVALGAHDAREVALLDGPGTRVADGRDPAAGVEVEVRDVTAVLRELGVRHIDLLKLNIEGGEYDVLDRLDATGWLEHIDDLLVQFHPKHPGAASRRRAIRRRLAETHTEVWDYPWVWERWERRR